MACSLAASSEIIDTDGNGSISIPPPSGLSAGDLWLVIVVADIDPGGTATINVPSGFTAVSNTLVGAGTGYPCARAFGKIATGSETTVAVTYSTTGGATYDAWAQNLRITGADAATWLGNVATATPADSGSTQAAPSVTVQDDGNLVVTWIACNIVSAITQPAGTTLLDTHVGGFPCGAVAYASRNAGAYSPGNWTLTGIDRAGKIVQTIEIRSAPDTTIAAELNATLDPVAISAASSVDVAGSLGATLAPVLLSAASAIDVTGALGAALDPVTLAAAANITDADVIAGQLSVTLDPVALSTHAQVDMAGALVTTLDPIGLDAHIGERESAPLSGGDDAPRRAVRHPGFSVKRARLRLQKDREFTESIRQIYRQLIAEPVTRERAEEIVAPFLGPVRTRGESEEAYRRALEERARRIERLSVEAEIALRLLHQELRELLERDDETAIAQLLGQVL